MSEELIFDAMPEVISLQIKDARTRELRKFEIRDMLGPARDAYLDTIKERTRVENGQAVGFKTFKGHQTDLIARMLVEITPTFPEGVEVSVEELNTWPGKLQAKLSKLCREVAGLDEKAEEKAKND